MPTSPIPELFSYKEAAEKLGISQATLRRWVSERTIEHTKIGRSVRFTEAQLSAMIETVHARPIRGRR